MYKYLTDTQLTWQAVLLEASVCLHLKWTKKFTNYNENNGPQQAENKTPLFWADSNLPYKAMTRTHVYFWVNFIFNKL